MNYNVESAEQISHFITSDILNIAKRLSDRRAVQVTLSYSKFNDLVVHLLIKRGAPPMSAPGWERLNFEKHGFSLDANTYVPINGSPGINIEITINPLSEFETFAELENFLLDVVRHEIEHVSQVNIRNPALRKSHQSSYRYFLLADEIPAAVAGLKLLARRQGIELETAIDNYLKPFQKSGFMTEPELEEVKSTWLNHAFSN